ncbi:hypothetical protein ACXZ1M_22365 [Duganella sp. PWIR1]
MRDFIRRLIISDRFHDLFAGIFGVAWSIGMIVLMLVLLSHHK